MSYTRQMLYPVPVVVEADVLIRDLQYAITALHELSRGRWSLGYHAAELPAEM